MDPVSVGLQTLQLALQSGVALHQFIQQSRNVNVTVRELAHEVTSLKNACEVVHGQLRRLAKEYELDGEAGEERTAISSSVREELESCKKTLNTLRNSLVDVRGDAPNFVAKGWQQFKLNMKQQEIVAMKSRIHAHTSALQVCLQVMDINVSYLAPKRVGTELKAKLDGLDRGIQRLQRLLREHCEMVESVLQIGSPVILSAANMANDSPESASVWSVVSERPDGSHQGAARQSDDGAQSLLNCAQDTLSRATSLYEESLYEPSISSRALSRTTASSRQRERVIGARLIEVEVMGISEPWSPGAEPKSNVPLNLPSTLEQSFVKLQEHLQVKNQAGIAHRPAVVSKTNSLTVGSKIGQNCRHPRASLRGRHGTPVRDEGRARPPREDSRETSPSSLSYLKHIEEELQRLDLGCFEESRKDILPNLTSPGPAPLCKNRVALTGRLGIGKSYAAAAVVRLTMQKSPKTPVFWICAAELEQDCRDITDRLHLQQPAADTTPWEWLCKILRRLSSTAIIGHWLVVIDGVDACVREHEIEKLAKIETGSCGHVLLTTRVRGHAESFAKEGLILDVSELDPVHAANMLGRDSESPISGTFDAVAFYLNFEPHAILNVRRFLQQTRMNIDMFATQMSVLTDEASWHEQGVATATARILGGKASSSSSSSSSSPTATTPRQPLDTSSLLPVVRCCLHPHWPMVFEELQRQSPAASELLGALSAIGRSNLISEFLLANDARHSASTTLLDQCLLSQVSGSFYADRMMLLAHRVWLLSRKELSAAYAKALKMVAHDYPEASRDPEWNRCKAFEPLAMAVTSDTANSWSGGNDTTRWLKSMLLQKRSKFFRDSGTNKWEGDELEAAEVAELRAIHGVSDMQNDL